MGWTSFADMPGMTPAQILCRELNGTNDNGANWTIVDHATKPGQFYGVCRFTAPGNDPIFYGVIVLFKRSKKTGEFFYKDMTETCGPVADRCPVRLVDMLDQLAPIDPADMRQSAQWARGWRDRCRANAKRKPAPAGQSLGGLLDRLPGQWARVNLPPCGPMAGAVCGSIPGRSNGAGFAVNPGAWGTVPGRMGGPHAGRVFDGKKSRGLPGFCRIFRPIIGQGFCT